MTPVASPRVIASQGRCTRAARHAGEDRPGCNPERFPPMLEPMDMLGLILAHSHQDVRGDPPPIPGGRLADLGLGQRARSGGPKRGGAEGTKTPDPKDAGSNGPSRSGNRGENGARRIIRTRMRQRGSARRRHASRQGLTDSIHWNCHDDRRSISVIPLWGSTFPREAVRRSR
jgi:hypothetical protein